MKYRATIFAAVFISIVSFSDSAQSEVCGSLAGMKGSVEILRMQRGVQEAVRNGFIVKRNIEPVECDDVIMTGKDSAAKVLLGEVRLVMGAETRIEIAEHTQAVQAAAPQVSLLALSYGKLRALVKRSPEAESSQSGARPAKQNSAGPGAKSERKGAEVFRVKTYSAVAGVRGTDFFTSYDPNTAVTGQATLEGNVVVRQSGSLQAVEVVSGNQVSVDPAPSIMGNRLKQERLEEGALGGGESLTKAMVVKPIQEATKTEIRAVSTLAKADPEFTPPRVIEILGKPETWTDVKEQAPKANDLKNEF